MGDSHHVYQPGTGAGLAVAEKQQKTCPSQCGHLALVSSRRPVVTADMAAGRQRHIPSQPHAAGNHLKARTRKWQSDDVVCSRCAGSEVGIHDGGTTPACICRVARIVLCVQWQMRRALESGGLCTARILVITGTYKKTPHGRSGRELHAIRPA